MSSWARYLLAPVFVLAVLGLVALALLGDLLAAGSGLSALLLILDTRILLALLVVAFGVAFLLYLYYLWGEDASRLVSGGRDVEALVPVYDEAEVMHRSVEHLAASEYEDLTVTIICEPDDGPGRERAGELAAEHERVRFIVNEERQGSKAGALNTAIEQSDADVIAMFDSDQEPHPKLIPHAMAYLTEYDAARVRSLPDPSGGILESMAYYEYLLLFFLPQKLVRFFLGMGFVGTRSVLLNRKVFDEVGLFSEGHLTEDMDFTHRCHQAGVRIRELFYYPTLEQPAHAFRDWWGQRIRWMTGHVEVGHSQVTDWRNWLDTDALGSVLTLVGTFAAGVVMSTTVPKLLLAAISSPVVVGAGLAGFYGLPLLTRLVDNRTGLIEGVGLGWLLLPVAFSLFGLVILQVIVNYAFGLDRGWYQVEKEA
jgi:cellulose synthase/poly-beta-1,6-N-acetylglucosamine synthase-like glycosyltransferase